jgi:cyclopropane-fatty-acyl-phospholipid synthase
VTASLERALAGAGIAVIAPAAGGAPQGAATPRTRVTLHDPRLLRALERLDLLTLAEAYVGGRVDVHGDLLDVMRIGDRARPTPTWLARLRLLAQVYLPGAPGRRRHATAFHYDRPAEFFLPWLDARWRSYSHGLYAAATDTLEDAQERKLALAVDALRVGRDAEVLDIGTGWGCFLEYAGRRGIRVHGLTTSSRQFRFVQDVIAREHLPCTVEHADFLITRPRRRFSAVACLGCFEHMPHYARVARQLAAWTTPDARLYADFCAQPSPLAFGPFLARHVWPGPTACVATGSLTAALTRQGFAVEHLADDTASYEYTVRDWADRLAAAHVPLAAAFGEASVRTFLLYLRASQHFFATGRTQAQHLVAIRTAERSTWTRSSAS